MYGGQDRILKHTTLYSKGFETRPQLAGAMGESAMHALPHTLTPALKRLSSTCYSRVLKAPDFPHIQTLRWPPVMQRLHLHLMFAHALIGCLCGLRQTEVLKNRYHPFKNDKLK